MPARRICAEVSMLTSSASRMVSKANLLKPLTTFGARVGSMRLSSITPKQLATWNRLACCGHDIEVRPSSMLSMVLTPVLHISIEHKSP